MSGRNDYGPSPAVPQLPDAERCGRVESKSHQASSWWITSAYPRERAQGEERTSGGAEIERGGVSDSVEEWGIVALRNVDQAAKGREQERMIKLKRGENRQ